MTLRPFQSDDEPDRETDRDELFSPEMEALADQLADDARMLSERYPAPSPSRLIASAVDTSPSPVIASAARRQHWRKIVAASVLVAASLAALVTMGPGEQQNQDQNHKVANEARETIVPESLPAVSFQEFSGPEQEAVLDLLEENALGQGSLSI